MFAAKRLFSRPAVTTPRRNFSTLVLAEHFMGKLNPSLGSVLNAASQLNDPHVDVLVHGDSTDAQIEAVQKYPGVSNIIVAKHDSLANPYGDHISHTVKKLVDAKGYDKVVAAASGFGKDVMPRLGGLLDLQAITDVIDIVDGGAKFKRPIYAGNAIATVSSADATKLITVRPTNFEKLQQGESHGYATEDVEAVIDGVKGSWK